MKRFLPALVVTLSFVALPMTAWAQAWRGTGRLHGLVVDKNTGKPIQGAKVTLVSIRAGKVGPAPIITKSNGKWAALGLMGGEWYVDAEAEGYIAAQRSLVLNELERLPPMEIELEPLPPPQQTDQSVVQIGGKNVPPEVVAAIESGNAFIGEEKYEQAVVEYEKALSGAPEFAAIKRALAQAYHRAGKLPQARRLLIELNDADPANLGDAYALASMYLQEEKLDEAKTILDKVPDSSFTDPAVLIDVGKYFYNANKGQQAYDYFSRAIKVEKDRAESYYYRGLASLVLSKPAEAKADLQKVIELAPESSEAREAAEMLKSLQ